MRPKYRSLFLGAIFNDDQMMNILYSCQSFPPNFQQIVGFKILISMPDTNFGLDATDTNFAVLMPPDTKLGHGTYKSNRFLIYRNSYADPRQNIGIFSL